MISDYQAKAQDRATLHVDVEALPSDRTPQQDPSNLGQKLRILEKLKKFLHRHYLEDDKNQFVTLLISFFDMLKGSDDIRVIFNGTFCGLNEATRAPLFPLPTAQTHLQGVKQGT